MFREEQQFRQPWLWILLAVTLLPVAALFGYGMVQQLIDGKPWGDNPMSDTALLIVGSATILFSLGLIYVFFVLKLITEVREEGLYIRFYPFPHRMIRYGDIKSCKARTYRPIMEYGGWGIRYGFQGKGGAYNVYGDQGVQLHCHKGKPLLIGSQKAERLAQAINSRINR